MGFANATVLNFFEDFVCLLFFIFLFRLSIYLKENLNTRLIFIQKSMRSPITHEICVGAQAKAYLHIYTKMIRWNTLQSIFMHFWFYQIEEMRTEKKCSISIINSFNYFRCENSTNKQSCCAMRRLAGMIVLWENDQTLIPFEVSFWIKSHKFSSNQMNDSCSIKIIRII